MKLTDKGLFALALHEGIVPGPYLDSVGVWTFGIGHTAAAGAPVPASMPRGMPTDLDEALQDVFAVFRRDVAKYEAAVARAVTVPLAPHQFDALVSFHYNTGAIGRATLTKKLNAGDYDAAGNGLMAWVKPPELRKRREAERDLFLRGIYPTGRATVWGVNTAGKVIWKPVRSLSVDDFFDLVETPYTADPGTDNRSLWARLLTALLGIIKGR